MVEHRAASAVAYNPETAKYLLMKRAKDKKHYPGVWQFPGGTIEKEEKPSETALRELEEETGLEGKIVKQSGKFFWNDVEAYAFVIEVKETEVDITREHTDYEWIELEEIEKYEASELNRLDLKKLGLP